MANVPWSPTFPVPASLRAKKHPLFQDYSQAESSSSVATSQSIQMGANQCKTRFGPKPDHGDAMSFSQQPFPFMKLPPEIRNMIIKEAFCFEFNVQCSRGLAPVLENDIRSIGFTSRGLRASKAFYNAAAPIYFRYNTFVFHSYEAMRMFLAAFGVQSRRSIRSVAMFLEYGIFEEAARLLRGCVSLRRLSITIPCDFLHCGADFMLAMAKYHGIKAILRHIRGIENLEVFSDRCAEIEDEDIGTIIQALEDIKQPYTATALRLQDKKDFVWGKTNVTTRSMQTTRAQQAKGVITGSSNNDVMDQ
ncbi:MAG: hypothetical protein Q9183_000825 [Haloplaca sp. 2 TL-2023]